MSLLRIYDIKTDTLLSPLSISVNAVKQNRNMHVNITTNANVSIRLEYNDENMEWVSNWYSEIFNNQHQFKPAVEYKRDIHTHIVGSVSLDIKYLGCFPTDYSCDENDTITLNMYHDILDMCDPSEFERFFRDRNIDIILK